MVLFPRLLGHGLDRLEPLALHDVEIAEHALGLGADDAFQLPAHAVCRARCVGDELADLVEEPARGLRHLWKPFALRGRSLVLRANYGVSQLRAQAAGLSAP